MITPGERVVLADLSGPGRVTHIWMTVTRLRALNEPSPRFLRAQVLEVFYDDLTEPSVSVPALDLFGVVHGVPASYASSLTACNDGLGLDARIPMPFGERIRVEYENASDEIALLYYQVDVLLGPQPDGVGVLHAMFTRENPTTHRRDLVDPRRAARPRPLSGYDRWCPSLRPALVGRGRDQGLLRRRDRADDLRHRHRGLPRLGLGSRRVRRARVGRAARGRAPPRPDGGWSLVSFYRWHLSDPIVFRDSIKVTLQQIGSAVFGRVKNRRSRCSDEDVTTAGDGWIEGGFGAFTLYERSDDWCATGFAYCRDAQPVVRVDAAVRDRGSRRHPRRSPSDAAIADEYPWRLMPRRFWVETLGCPKNQVDSDKLTGTLVADGLVPADAPADADLVVVNTCAFIEEARQESIETILGMAGARKRGARLVVTGCLAERSGAELATALPEVDAVAGFARGGAGDPRPQAGRAGDGPVAPCRGPRPPRRGHT